MSAFRVSLLFLSVWHAASGQTYRISTFAGGGLPVNIPGISAGIGKVSGVAVDSARNVFVSIPIFHIVLRLDAVTGVLTLAAGNGTPGFSGDNGPATSAQLFQPHGLAVDSAGNLYIADTLDRIRKVSNGVITTVAGGGSSLGDNGPATSAQLSSPDDVAVDSAGNLYIADSLHGRVRKVSKGLITTVAGNGTLGFSGDSGPATSAQLAHPEGITVDSAGNLYIAERNNSRVRKVSDGVITTVAGNGTFGFSGDNGPATSAQLDEPLSVAVDSAGNLYIADRRNRIRKVSNGVITTVAGGGSSLGDNGPATSAEFSPGGIALDSAGNLYIADSLNHRVRMVSKGLITTVAGNGTVWFSGDNGPAISAQLYNPRDLALDPAGNLYIADGNDRVRKVSNGVITTVAGGGASFRDNVPAISGQLQDPHGVAVDSAGNLYIADTLDRIRKVSNGVITTVAGGGFNDPATGDDGPATSAQLLGEEGIAVDSASNLYIADSLHYRVRKVSKGVITTIAGNGTKGLRGDNSPATRAELNKPIAVAVDSAGDLYIADGNNRIRKVSKGVIATIAGNGTKGFGGDNGPATSAQLNGPEAIAVDSAGDLYIADSLNNRVRKVSKGVITTIAGGGASFRDNVPASDAFFFPQGIAVDASGRVYVSDGATNRIRLLTPAP